MNNSKPKITRRELKRQNSEENKKILSLSKFNAGELVRYHYMEKFKQITGEGIISEKIVHKGMIWYFIGEALVSESKSMITKISEYKKRSLGI